MLFLLLVALVNASVTVPLAGGSMAGGQPFVLDMVLGGQRVKLQPDTAAGETVVSSPDRHFGTGYAPHASASAEATTCGACRNTSAPSYLSCAVCSTAFCGTCRTDVAWPDGSAALAYDYRDRGQLGIFSTPLVVAAAFQMSGPLAGRGSDGVLGLGYTRGGVPSFLDSAAGEGGLPNLFSLCFGPFGIGVLTLGDADAARVASGSRPVSLAIDSSGGLVQVPVSAISLQQNVLEPVRHGGAVLASRSDFIELSAAAFAKVAAWLAQAAAAAPGAASGRALRVLQPSEQWSCFSRPELASFVPCLPPLQFAFVGGGDGSVAVPAWSYLAIQEGRPECPDEYAVRLSLRASDAIPPAAEFVLGLPFLRAVHLTVDRANGRAVFNVPAARACGIELANVTDTSECVPYTAPWFGVLPNWAVAAIVLSIVVLAAAVVLVVCCCRRRKQRRDREDFMLADAGSFDPNHEENVSLFGP